MLYGIQDISVLLGFFTSAFTASRARLIRESALPKTFPERHATCRLPSSPDTSSYILLNKTILCKQSWELFMEISDDAIGIDGLSSSRNDRCTGRYRQWQRRNLHFHFVLQLIKFFKINIFTPVCRYMHLGWRRQKKPFFNDLKKQLSQINYNHINTCAAGAVYIWCQAYFRSK